MSVPTETSRSIYIGDGATNEFDAGFYFQRKSDLKVKLKPSGGTETVLVEGVHYTVSLPTSVGADDGYIEMVTPPGVGDVLVIERDVAFVQDTSFRSQGQFSPAVHEDAMDRIVFQIQELARRVADLESAGTPGSVVAGDGLYFSGTTLHIGQGDGVVVQADGLSVRFGNASEMSAGAWAGVNEAGTALKVARIDHRHRVLTAAPPNNAVQAGQNAEEGTATTLARSDHKHRVACDVPVAVTKAPAAEGTSTLLSRADHKHDVATASAVELSDNTSAEGVASTLARSDHVHAHGARGGGNLHALATTTTAGFMSPTDKAKLDGLATTLTTEGTITTTDATPTKVAQFRPDDNSAEVVEVLVVGKKVGGTDAGSYIRAFGVRRYDGVTALIGSGSISNIHTLEDAAGWDVTVSVASPDVNIFVTGAAATTINWRCVIRRVQVKV
jgi:hypothetical protein